MEGKAGMHRLLGFLLVRGGFVRASDVERALAEQRTTNQQLGEILVRMGCLDARQLQAVLSIQDRLSDVRQAVQLAAGIRLKLGELLLAAGHVTAAQLEEALAEQQRSGERLGEIALRRGWLAPEQLQDVLRLQDLQGTARATAGPLQLGEILVAGGDISREQLEEALARHRSSGRPVGMELVDAGWLAPGRLAGALRLQRMLVMTALGTALAVGGMAGAMPAQAAPGGSAQVSIGATVLRHASVRVLSAPQSVQITEADIARGYVDVPLPSRLEIRSNSPSGYLLSVETQADFARGTEVRGLGGVASLGRFGGVLQVASTAAGMHSMQLELGFRILLSPGVQAGLHAWPVQISVLPV